MVLIEDEIFAGILDKLFNFKLRDPFYHSFFSLSQTEYAICMKLGFEAQTKFPYLRKTLNSTLNIPLHFGGDFPRNIQYKIMVTWWKSMAYYHQ